MPLIILFFTEDNCFLFINNFTLFFVPAVFRVSRKQNRFSCYNPSNAWPQVEALKAKRFSCYTTLATPDLKLRLWKEPKLFYLIFWCGGQRNPPKVKKDWRQTPQPPVFQFFPPLRLLQLLGKRRPLKLNLTPV